MIIRKATQGDLPRLLQIQKLAYRSEAAIYNDFSIPPLLETVLELQADHESGTILVAEEGTEVTGSIRGKSIGTSVAIGRLSVLPGRQGKGVGTSLLHEIEKSFPKAIRFELFTGHKSEKNKQFYQRLGYRWYRDEKIYENISLYWMEKHREIIQAEIRDQ